MRRRIRHQIGRLSARPRQWIIVLSFVLTSVLIVRRVAPSGFQFEVFPRSLDLKEPEEPRNEATSLLAANVGVGKGWERHPSDKYGREQQLVKTREQTGFKENVYINLLKNADKVKTTDQVEESIVKRGVNVHIWRELCCPKVNSLRQYPLFPTLPKQRLLRHTINSGPLGTWYGQRIMGYVHPPRSGNYTFHLNAHVFAEFWLSEKPNIKGVELMAKIAKENRKSSIAQPVGQTSSEVYLEAGRKYFFDVLHVMNGGMMRRDHVNVTWKVPGSEEFTEVSEKFLSPLLDEKSPYLIPESSTEKNKILREPPSVIDTEVNDADAGEDDEDYEGMEIPKRKIKFSDEFSFYYGEDFDKENQYNRTNFEQLPDISDEILSVLPSCSYEPTYAKKQVLKRFEGVWQTHFSSVFPDDGSKEFICIGNKQKNDCEGNDFLTEPDVLSLIQMLEKNINEKHPGNYALRGIVNIEKNLDAFRGNRYLLELVFRDRARNRIVKLSDFVYKFHNSSSLYKPKGITWQRKVTVNVILTVKNQGAWAQHFIDEMARICEETRDDHVNIIVVDYGNQDLDIKTALRRSSLKNYRVLKRIGAFHKTEAIQSAVSTISDPHSVVLLYDLHLLTPTNIFSAVRKHTVEGRMTFTPVLFRLTFCGRPQTSTTQSKGFWETFGFGIFSIFKSDWDRFGGMNVQAFQHTWGGEDWEMIDRVLAVGLEVERLRMPGFFHFYHSKVGMWDNNA